MIVVRNTKRTKRVFTKKRQLRHAVYSRTVPEITRSGCKRVIYFRPQSHARNSRGLSANRVRTVAIAFRGKNKRLVDKCLSTDKMHNERL